MSHVSDGIGYGTVALRLIPRGTITGVRDILDQVFLPAQIEAMSPIHRRIMNKFAYQDRRGDSILCWDHARFVNHSCAPTCLSPGFDFEIAVRDIPPGEELADDYGTLCITESFDCLCGAPECRHVIRPDDPERETSRWDEAVAAAFPLIGTVDQPLWSLVREQAQVEALLRQGIRPPSGRIHQPGHAR